MVKLNNKQAKKLKELLLQSSKLRRSLVMSGKINMGMFKRPCWMDTEIFTSDDDR